MAYALTEEQYEFTRNPDQINLIGIVPSSSEAVRLTYTQLWTEEQITGDSVEVVANYAISLAFDYLAELTAISDPLASSAYAVQATAYREIYLSTFASGYRTAFIAELKASLQDTAQIFIDADYERFTNNALRDYDRVKPQYIFASFELVAEQQIYPVPPDLVKVFDSLYGISYLQTTKKWDQLFTKFPKLFLINKGSIRELWLNNKPSSSMIQELGTKYEYIYIASHILTDTISTIEPELLLIRAQAEAMKEVSMRNITKPVLLRTNVAGSTTINGVPSSLYILLLEEFEKMCGN